MSEYDKAAEEVVAKIREVTGITKEDFFPDRDMDDLQLVKDWAYENGIVWDEDAEENEYWRIYIDDGEGRVTLFWGNIAVGFLTAFCILFDDPGFGRCFDIYWDC